LIALESRQIGGDVSLHEQLSTHLAGFRSAPLLFAGAGLSRRYLDLESWEGLLRRYAAEAGRPYEYYFASADGDLPAVASAIATDMHERWWNEDRYLESRNLFASAAVRRDSALKIEIARYMASSIDRLPVRGPLATEIEKLRGIVIDGIVTTNYDPLLEKLFPDFRAFIGQDELLFSDPQGIGEIYKIHGSHDDPNSLVLTAEDYERFRDRNPYLAAKLLTIFVEHPVVFVGYSLNDPNVIDILLSIAACLTTENIGKLQDRLVFVQWDPDATAPKLGPATIVTSGLSIPVITASVADFGEVFDALAGLHRKFPVRLLRRLKEHVYKLVLEKEPVATLYAQDLEADTDLTDAEVVIGVGIADRIHKRGYRALDRLDLVDDVLNNDGNFDPKSIVRDALPELLKSMDYVPLYKYLRGAGYLSEDGRLRREEELDSRVIARSKRIRQWLVPPKNYLKTADTVLGSVHGFDELRERGGISHVLYYGLLLPDEDMNTTELLTFLKDQRGRLNRYSSPYKSQYFKLVCLYDWLLYSGRRPKDITA
jgi:hypothetical protein